MQPSNRPDAGLHLPVALGVSMALHLVLLWPSPVTSNFVARPSTAGLLRLMPVAPFPPVPEVREADVRSVSVRPDVPERTGGAVRPDDGRDAAKETEISSGPPEGGLRALRFALARSIAEGGLEVVAPGASLTLELRLLARRVVGVAVVRTSGDHALDARILATFKAAARAAVIPDSLPPDGFTVELELEGGAPERSIDDPPNDAG